METGRISLFRPAYFTIGSQDADIILPQFKGAIIVKGKEIFIQKKAKDVWFVNDKAIYQEKVLLENGDVLLMGDVSIILVENAMLIEGNIEKIHTQLPVMKDSNIPFEGFPKYKRSPRIIKRVYPEKIQLEKPKELMDYKKGGLVQLIVPPVIMIVITIAISVIMKRGLFVVMAVAGTGMSLIVSIMHFFSDKKELKENKILREQTYKDYLLRKRKELYQAYCREKEAYRYNYPSMDEIQKMIEEYSTRIYERTYNDEDFLKVSLGEEKTHPELQIQLKLDELKTKPDILEDEAKAILKEFSFIEKPVVIDLKRAHLGLVGEKSVIHEQMKALVCQLTFFHSYHELEIIAIYDETYQEDFQWMRWYPHFKIHMVNSIAMINSENKRDQILGSLYQILKDRKQKEEESKKESTYLPYFLFLIDEPKWIMDHSIMEYLEKEGNNLGFSIIYTSHLRANLPENIGTIAMLKNSEEGFLLINEGEEKQENFRLHNIQKISLEWLGRNLGVLEHIRGISAQIPNSITFFQMYQVERPSQLRIEERWGKNNASNSLSVPLGARAAEDYVCLNLHEKAHGPHGLVAGTTGSGKSEILQSYILSLAVNYNPYEVAFLLIDYKGGGMAKMFTNLPHLLGTITNLDGSQSMRALASIKSELERRQSIFNHYSVNHINSYNKLFKNGEAEEPLPHLFIISDEFAELKKEQPEFMSELVSAARIGRSLGVHLILATQKPTGVVDDQIWSNSRFKLALKVQNVADSKEILKTADAANITLPGRVYLQVGNNEIYELFQSAWSGAAYNEEEQKEKVDDRVYVLNEIGQGELVNQDLSDTKENNKVVKTQLDAVVRYIHEYYEAQDVKEVKKPWLPPLPEQLVSPQELIRATQKELNMKISMGLIDIPEKQEQITYDIDFIKDGNLLYIASAGYGKTVFLTTAVLSLAMQNSVQDLNFYILDFGNSGLMPLNKLSHVADYIVFDDSERFQKLVGILQKEIRERKKKLADAVVQNFEVYNQVSAEKMKAIVLVIDNFDVVKELGYEAEEFFQKISRDGYGLGIFVIATATRSNSMKYSTYNNFKNKVAGYLFDESDVNLIVGRSTYKQSETKGRALLKYDNMISVMQLYSMVGFETELEYKDKIEALIQNIDALYPGEQAPRIPVLPENLFFADMKEYPHTEQDIYVGLEKEAVCACGFQLGNTPFTILGEAARGKTNVLKVILDQMLGKGKIYLVDSKAMELYSYKTSEEVVYIENQGMVPLLIDALKTAIAERNQKVKEALEIDPTLNPKEICRELQPFSLIVDDWDNFVELTKTQAMTLAPILNEAAGVGISIILTAHSGKMKGFDEVTKFAKNTTEGLLLGNQGTSAIFPINSAKELPPFKDGLLFHNGAYVKVRVPKY